MSYKVHFFPVQHQKHLPQIIVTFFFVKEISNVFTYHSRDLHLHVSWVLSLRDTKTSPKMS